MWGGHESLSYLPLRADYFLWLVCGEVTRNLALNLKLPSFTGSSVVVKYPPVNAEDTRDASLIPGSGRSPGIGNGNSLQYSCLEDSMDKGDLQATGAHKSEMTEWQNTHNLAFQGTIPSSIVPTTQPVDGGLSCTNSLCTSPLVRCFANIQLYYEIDNSLV